MNFFIVGSGRCGSTLLMRMLNCHSDLYVFNETHWIPKLYEVFGSSKAQIDELFQIVGHTNHVNGQPTTPLTAEDCSAIRKALGEEVTVREFVDALGKRIAASQGKIIWADKTPDYCAHLGVLHRLWPNARFVHLIRDGEAVARSMQRHPGYRHLVSTKNMCWTSLAYGAEDRWDCAPEVTMEETLRLWRLRVARARDASRRLPDDGYREFRFEALIADPITQLRELSAYLQLSAGSWVKEAAALVEPQRINQRTQSADSISTDAQTQRLMQELEYSNSVPGQFRCP